MLAIDGRARSSGLNWRRDRAPAAGIEPLPLSPQELKNESEGVSLETYRSNLAHLPAFSAGAGAEAAGFVVAAAGVEAVAGAEAAGLVAAASDAAFSWALSIRLCQHSSRSCQTWGLWLNTTQRAVSLRYQRGPLKSRLLWPWLQPPSSFSPRRPWPWLQPPSSPQPVSCP